MTDNLRDRIGAALWDFCRPAQVKDDLPETPDVVLKMADAVIAALNLAKPCESGCVWQIPNRFQDMTPQQKELLEGWENDD